MWILLSICAGLFDAFRDASSKASAGAVPRLLISWSYSALALPFFFPRLLYAPSLDSLPLQFWGLCFVEASLHVIGGIFLVRALSSSDFSLCAPISAFTPVFLLIVTPFITGDLPSLAGISGALLVVLGSYILSLGSGATGIFGPFRALFKDEGVRLMFLLAILWSITGSIDRLAVKTYDLSAWAAMQLVFISVLFLPVLLLRGAFQAPRAPGAWKKMLGIGALNAISYEAYLQGLQLAPAYYVICLKRLSILFSIIIGSLIFKERGLRGRLLGGALMLLGVIVISLWG